MDYGLRLYLEWLLASSQLSERSKANLLSWVLEHNCTFPVKYGYSIVEMLLLHGVDPNYFLWNGSRRSTPWLCFLCKLDSHVFPGEDCINLHLEMIKILKILMLNDADLEATPYDGTAGDKRIGQLEFLIAKTFSKDDAQYMFTLIKQRKAPSNRTGLLSWTWR